MRRFKMDVISLQVQINMMFIILELKECKGVKCRVYKYLLKRLIVLLNNVIKQKIKFYLKGTILCEYICYRNHFLC